MKQKTVTPNKAPNFFLFWSGLAILALNCIRHRIQGYTTPRTFSPLEFERAALYDIKVVNGWLGYLKEYLGTDGIIKGKKILELGPGEDLGVGLTLIAQGAAKYNTLDAHYLLKNTPEEFYEVFFKLLKEKCPQTDEAMLRYELKQFMHETPQRLNYVHEPNYDLSVFEKNSIDIVFSQAAVEHISDLKKTIKSLGELVVSGGIAVILIDFKTHSRWIRDKDPLNIYRYSNPVYNLFSFSGVPNRFRPHQYKQMFESNGWGDVKIFEKTILANKYISETAPHMAKQFRHSENEMHILTGVLCATKK